MRFPPQTNWIAYALAVIFIVAFATAPKSEAGIVMVPIISLILLVMLTATNGVKINKETKQYQYYFSVFGISVGKWKKWYGYSCFVIKSSRKKQDRRLTRDFVDRESSTRRFMTTELYMMDSTHRKKLLCGSFLTYNEAKKKVLELKRKFDYPLQKFSPKRIARKR